jgi:pyruvate/2-oxoglutarate/acetoin dehydrogenase E1 component/TPP-dependent pyruvate/acetoin dehydrogenase alpha subunit
MGFFGVFEGVIYNDGFLAQDAHMEKDQLKALNLTRQGILTDYRVSFRSREASLVGRREVFSGKAKFGIFGDGKEVAQVALARTFRKGDFRSGYYRDQTLMMALGMTDVSSFFAQLYADADLEREPSSAGRSMTAHFGTRSLDEHGNWNNLTEMYNSSADVSPTGSQMPRLVGLGYASVLYRELKSLHGRKQFSSTGDEIAYGTIGNASCAEGLFWESVNAIGVLRAPVLLSIWDDNYGISVPNEYQITKGDLSEVLSGFQRDAGSKDGFDIYRVAGWDYAALCETYINAARTVREERVPAIVHVTELTQPQGHSTSGSHERYKDKQRLAWEEEFDCIRQMRQWILEQGLAEGKELDRLEKEETQLVRDARSQSWHAFIEPIEAERDEAVALINSAAAGSSAGQVLSKVAGNLKRAQHPHRRDIQLALQDALVASRHDDGAAREVLRERFDRNEQVNRERYSSHLHSASAASALEVPTVEPQLDDGGETLRGFEILNRCFDSILDRHPEVVAFGEDVGKLGDVNQGFSGLQEKYGEARVGDTGIREATILGQAIGMAMRGLRPIVEIQYLDYILYALQIMSDDLATLQYRTLGGQKAPVIVRTRGHRLEGIWHSGSPMAGVINLVRGVWVCVPRDMTRAAGFYNTLLRSDDPGLVVEVLNGYRMKEPVPQNLSDYTLPLGVPEVIRQGADCTVVTYGACCRIVLDAAAQLAELGVDLEVIDVQTLLPFDRHGLILDSLRKTSRVVFVDEDVPGGTTAYMLQQVLDRMDGYYELDSPPRALSAQPHRPAYGSDGDYWSKPNRDQIVRTVYELMHDADPRRYPRIF